MDIIAYNYYKGLIYAALKKYQKAIDCFRLVVSLPTQVTHRVHLESYKKLILLSLIQHSKMPSLPNSTSPVLKLRFDNFFTTYKNLGTAYIQK